MTAKAYWSSYSVLPLMMRRWRSGRRLNSLIAKRMYPVTSLIDCEAKEKNKEEKNAVCQFFCTIKLLSESQISRGVFAY